MEDDQKKKEGSAPWLCAEDPHRGPRNFPSLSSFSTSWLTFSKASTFNMEHFFLS